MRLKSMARRAGGNRFGWIAGGQKRPAQRLGATKMRGKRSVWRSVLWYCSDRTIFFATPPIQLRYGFFANSAKTTVLFLKQNFLPIELTT